MEAKTKNVAKDDIAFNYTEFYSVHRVVVGIPDKFRDFRNKITWEVRNDAIVNDKRSSPLPKCIITYVSVNKEEMTYEVHGLVRKDIDKRYVPQISVIEDLEMDKKGNTIPVIRLKVIYKNKRKEDEE